MLSSACRSEEFACKAGYKRFSDGSTRCYPTGCQEGALQVSLYTRPRLELQCLPQEEGGDT